MIQKHCDMHGIKISKRKIIIIYWKGKNHQSLLLHGKETVNEYPEKNAYCFKMKTLVTRENAQTLKSISKYLNTSVGAINKIIRKTRFTS